MNDPRHRYISAMEQGEDESMSQESEAEQSDEGASTEDPEEEASIVDQGEEASQGEDPSDGMGWMEDAGASDSEEDTRPDWMKAMDGSDTEEETPPTKRRKTGRAAESWMPKPRKEFSEDAPGAYLVGEAWNALSPEQKKHAKEARRLAGIPTRNPY